MGQSESIGLQEAIRSLRAELTGAMDEGSGKELRFRVGPVELEFLVEVGREASAEGGVKFWVVSLGAKGGVTSSATHRIKLSLEPVSVSGGPIDVGDKSTRPPG